VAWHDFRNDRYYQPAATSNEELYWDAYLTSSTDGAAHVAWGDSRRGTLQLPTEDYYFTSVVYDRDLLAAAGSDDSERPAACSPSAPPSCSASWAQYCSSFPAG
jgi:hypothetical protein